MEEHVTPVAHDKRSDLVVRHIFAEAFALVVPFMNPDGSWISAVHEYRAYEAMRTRFADLTEMRLFGVMSGIVMARASGRQVTVD